MSSLMRMHSGKIFWLSTAMVISFVAVTLVQRRASAVRKFRGVLRYPMLNIGGEGSDVKLVMATKAFDLILSRELRRDLHLPALDGKSVVVVGFPIIARGIERRRYDAIRVISIARDVIVSASPE